MNRRKFIKNSFYAATGVALAGGLYAWQIAPFQLEFTRLPMPIRGLPSALAGRTLMQISDIHIGERFDHDFVIRSFNKAKAYAPDIVVYTGDYITLHNGVPQYEKLQEVLAASVKGKIATIAILGNHDHGVNWAQPEVADRIQYMLTANGIHVLRNDSIQVQGLNIFGFDDLWASNFGGADVLKALDRSAANLVLCHNPDACDLPIWNGYDGWILAGHTHGGQVKPPFLSPPMLPVQNKRYSAGLIPLDDGRTLYINRALGHLWQVRFNVRPEITLFDLQRKS